MPDDDYYPLAALMLPPDMFKRSPILQGENYSPPRWIELELLLALYFPYGATVEQLANRLKCENSEVERLLKLIDGKLGYWVEYWDDGREKCVYRLI